MTLFAKGNQIFLFKKLITKNSSCNKHLCDGECGDYLNRKDDNYWFDGWFACESCADADRYVGTYKPQELQEIKYYEEHPDDLLKDINGYEYWDRFKAKVRRSCVLCNIELPEWV
jgi:hypothetical protein